MTGVGHGLGRTPNNRNMPCFDHCTTLLIFLFAFSLLLILYRASFYRCPRRSPIAIEKKGLDPSFCLLMLFSWKEEKEKKMDGLTAQEVDMRAIISEPGVLLHIPLPILHFFFPVNTLLFFLLSPCMHSDWKIIANWPKGFESRQRHEHSNSEEKW